MNLQQLEYIVAVDTYRHFSNAAEKSFVTQPTLSMMIQKLEEELDVKIFDRTKQPVTATKHGAEIIRQARAILKQVNHLKDYASDSNGNVAGELRLGIIPTLAPYLLPLFLKSFHEKYPGIRISIKEMVTDDIILKLNAEELDMGLLATPLHDPKLVEHPLFYEEFFAYASKNEKLPKKKYLLPREINIHQLWLLEEGHCLRNQVFNLCELKKHDMHMISYEAGSIETLINLVDHNQGITIIPKLAELNLKPHQKKNIREFSNPKPVREISLITTKHFIRKRLLNILKEEITHSVPADMLKSRQARITDTALPDSLKTARV